MAQWHTFFAFVNIVWYVMGFRSKNKKEPALSSKDESFISSCRLLGLSADDALALYQILQTEEELFYFSLYEK